MSADPTDLDSHEQPGAGPATIFVSDPSAEADRLSTALRGKGYAVILSHGPGEEGVAARWRAALPRARVAPVLPLEDLGALVAGCRLMLGADTGITHLADQLGVRVLSWYTLWPPERNGPYFSPGLVFYRRPPDMGEIAAWMESLGL